MRSFFRLFFFAILATAAAACSDLREGGESVEFKVEPSLVAMEVDDVQFAINVICSSVWTVSELPEWIELEKVSAVENRAFTWEFIFKCSASEFDRTGCFKIADSGNTEFIVTIEQKGLRGPEIHVLSVSVSPETLVMHDIGETQQLSADVAPSNAVNKDVFWESSDETIATVDQSGLVTAVAFGNVEISVTADDGGYSDTCYVAVIKNVIHVSSVTLSPTSLELVPGQTETIVASVLPEDADNKSVVWETSDESVATVSNTGTVTAVSVGNAVIRAISQDNEEVFDSCPVTVKAAQPDAVDLGLPSGLKWASWNIGASAPEEYGDYFAWGETEPKDNYNWSTYKWCNGDYNKQTKYCTDNSYWDSSDPMDNKTVLDLEDDAAHVNWGGNWRMPTLSEQQELLDNCTWTWTTNYNGIGVSGYIVSGKKSAYTDRSIFLPAAGYRYDTSLYSVGSRGYYWSSSLDTGGPSSAYRVGFYSGYRWYGYRSYRYYGFSVRPVTEK